jgi:hypothetical protein
MSEVNVMRRDTEAWARRTSGLLRRSAARFIKGKLVNSRTKTVNIKGGNSFKAREEKLKVSLRHRVFARPQGLPERVRFNYAYHGFFVERGLGPGNRLPVRWLTPVVEKQVAELGDMTARSIADATLKAIL